MKVIDFFDVAPNTLRKPHVTLGMFDGVHRGHQKLLSMVKEGPRPDRESVVITFREHPQKVLTGRGPKSIVSFETRIGLLESFGIDSCLVINFNREVAQITPEDFIKAHLVRRLGIASIVIGENISFGHRGKGNADLLKRGENKHGYRVRVADLSQLPDGSVISSTNIRKAVIEGDMSRARQMLGRPFSLYGEVVGGKHRGKNLGFPTANMKLFHDLIPREGVYGGYSTIEREVYPTLLSVGRCTTFSTDGELQVEAHIVGFSGDLYGKNLMTYVWERFRDQETFPDQETLRTQIAKDQELLMGRWRDYESDSLFVR